MKKVVFFFLFLFFTHTGFGLWTANQMAKVQVFAQAKKVGTHIQLTLVGRTEPGFHLYSIRPQGEFAPKPTQLVIEAPQVKTLGPMKESQPTLMVDEAIGESLWVHQGDFWISQTFVPVGKQSHIQGYLFYQLCDNLICLNPAKQPFETYVP